MHSPPALKFAVSVALRTQHCQLRAFWPHRRQWLPLQRPRKLRAGADETSHSTHPHRPGAPPPPRPPSPHPPDPCGPACTMHTHAHTHVHTHTHTRTHTHTHTRTHTYTRAHTHTRTHAHTHLYTTRAHTRTHAHAWQLERAVDVLTLGLGGAAAAVAEVKAQLSKTQDLARTRAGVSRDRTHARTHAPTILHFRARPA
jgi:hypothetical protein